LYILNIIGALPPFGFELFFQAVDFFVEA